jgi:hypothetical protein
MIQGKTALSMRVFPDRRLTLLSCEMPTAILLEVLYEAPCFDDFQDFRGERVSG